MLEQTWVNFSKLLFLKMIISGVTIEEYRRPAKEQTSDSYLKYLYERYMRGEMRRKEYNNAVKKYKASLEPPPKRYTYPEEYFQNPLPVLFDDLNVLLKTNAEQLFECTEARKHDRRWARQMYGNDV